MTPMICFYCSLHMNGECMHLDTYVTRKSTYVLPADTDVTRKSAYVLPAVLPEFHLSMINY